LVRAERQKRAWSQDHLAIVSGLGLRTIQRIEKTGYASYESVQALASVFSVCVERLGIRSSTQNTKISAISRLRGLRGLLAASSATLVAVVALLFGSASIADQIMLDVDASRRDNASNDEIREIGRLLVEEGKDAEMRINDVLRIVIAPELQEDGRVLLTAKVFEFLDSEYVLLAEPKLITANKKEAEIRISSESGGTFRFLITPHAN
jgi:transcriptional regulator with XRE-family HTH domain